MSNQPPTNEPWQQPYPGNQPYPQQPPQQNYGQPQWQQQQPYSPQQPMYQQQPMQPPPRKKSKTWLWIVLAVVGVLVLGCIGASALVSNASKNVNTGVATVSTQLTQPAQQQPTTAAAPQHFKQTDAVQAGNIWDIEIVSAKTSTGSEFNKPQKAGNVFLVFTIKVKNISNQEQSISSALQFTLLDSTGQKYDVTIDPDAGATLDGKVAVGSLLKGAVVYEVPANMHSFTLGFEVNIFSQGQVIWDIHT